jgi:hypothetical protein
MPISAGDLQNGLYGMAGPFTQASRASNAADVTVTKVWQAPDSVKIVSLTWIPTEGDQTAHATNNHQITVMDGGTAGAGAVAVATHAFTASLASTVPTSIASSAAVTLDAGDFVNVKFATAATASSTGKLFAGEYFIRYLYV